MAQTVKVLNWNIQNYGHKKSGLRDIVKAIAETVYSIHPDIFVLLELNTTKDATAKSVAASLCQALYDLSKNAGRSEYRLCILSPNTGMEFYAFFIRDHTKTVPLHPEEKNAEIFVPKIGGGLYTAFKNVEFRERSYDFPDGKIYIDEGASLLSPDIDPQSSFGRPTSVTFNNWPGQRRPALSMFWCPDAIGTNQLLPIIACHYAPNNILAVQQFKMLRRFSLIAGISPPSGSSHNTPVPLEINYLKDGVAGKANVCNYVLTGDFNVNYIDPAEKTRYNVIVGTTYPNLGGVAVIDDGTHLITPRFFSPRDYKNTKAMAVNGFDNFFLRWGITSTGIISFASPETTNMPELIRLRTIKLSQSVIHYAELDQRGLEVGDYLRPLVNFASQLLGNTMINLPGSLIGSRLISDHLPVSFTLNLP